MLKAGLIAGVVAVIVAAIATYFSPLCTPCAVLLLGGIAGYLGAAFDKPSINTAATRTGAMSGAVGGIGAVIGQLIGTTINGFVLGPEGAAQVFQNFGLPAGGTPGFDGGYWAGLVGGAICFSLLDVLFMAGFGALGGILWWQMTGKNANPPTAI